MKTPIIQEFELFPHAGICILGRDPQWTGHQRGEGCPSRPMEGICLSIGDRSERERFSGYSIAGIGWDRLKNSCTGSEFCWMLEMRGAFCSND
jgi:hypothetical protein